MPLRIVKYTVSLTLGACLALLLGANIYVLGVKKSPVTSTKVTDVGMILGASVYSDGTLSDALQHRVDTAYQEYVDEKFEKFLVSGDDRDEFHQEVESVVTYLLQKGVQKEFILTDCYGVDTYDSMWRATQLYDISSMRVYTQPFHLSRSVYLAKKMGVDALGVPVTEGVYDDQYWFEVREWFARVKAVIEAEIIQPVPLYSEEGECVL